MIVMLGMAVQTSPQARIRKRLLAVGSNPYATRAEVQGLLKETMYSQIPWVDGFLRQLNISRSVDLLLERANIDFSVSVFLLFSVFSGVIVFFVVTLFSQPLVIGLDRRRHCCFCPICLRKVFVRQTTAKIFGADAG